MREFAIDFSSILFLSLIKKHHTNIYRFSIHLTEAVDPVVLQQAVDRVYRRFPSVIASFRPDFFHYTQVAVSTPPQVQPDPGCLVTMGMEELQKCAYRVLYSGKTVSIEAFHALTDGFGAIASFTTLLAEYLRLKHGIHIPESGPLLSLEDAPQEHEWEDSYLKHQGNEPYHLPSRFAYQLPDNPPGAWKVLPTARRYPIDRVLDAAHRYGVSATALLSTILADAIMAVQHRHVEPKKHRPVRIMVPADLRRMFRSKTLRNFVLYAMPTLEPGQEKLPLKEKLRNFHNQIKEQLAPKQMASIMAYNVRTQQSPLFRFIPRAVKCGFMRLAYRFFGGSNSCISLTNLGAVRLPDEMRPYIENIEVLLTPREHSPYNCAVISYGDSLTINLTRFSPESELEEIFFSMLDEVLAET